MAIVRKFSHHFLVVTNDRRIIGPIYDYYRNRLSVFKFGRSKAGHKEIDKTFASANKDRTHFRFLINSYTDFIRYMASRGISEDTWKVEVVEMYKPVKVDFKCIFPYPLRPKQVEIKDFVFTNKETGQVQLPHGQRSMLNVYNPTRVIPLQMGGGKTLIALYCAAMLGVRTMIEVAPRYVQNWLNNVYAKEDDRKLDCDEKDVLLIRSINDLLKAVRKARSKYEKFDYKIIICHKTTISAFIKLYVDNDSKFKQFNIKVEDLYKVLGIGLIIRDEVHEELHANAKQDLHRHVPLVINLSATLEFDDPKVEEMCKLVFPIKDRFNAGEWNKYIDVRALMYRLQFPTKLKWEQYKGGPYNHAEFEKSILKDKQKKAYFAFMVYRCLLEYFDDVCEDGDKAAFYCTTVDMCNYLTTEIQTLFPDKVVNKYTSEDDYGNLVESDIVFTTPGSAGTGVDIKKLRRVFLSIGVKSSQRNFQIKGRLREILDLDSKGVVKDTVFYYFVCTDIHQHLDYHNFKKFKFKNRVKSHEEIVTDFVL